MLVWDYEWGFDDVCSFVGVTIVKTEVGEVGVVVDEFLYFLLGAACEQNIGESGFCDCLPLAFCLFDGLDGGVVCLYFIFNKVFVGFVFSAVSAAQCVPMGCPGCSA